MHFAHIIQNRKGLASVIFFVLIVGISTAAFVLLSGKFQGPFDVNELYGILD
jgi:hypothetical protein